MNSTLRAPKPEFSADDVDLRELTELVTKAARGLRHGSIEVIVHDARVVQIVRTEKTRIAK